MTIAAFILGSGLLIYISRASLRAPRSHGFHRFFAWECILCLFLLNFEYWFFKPFAWNQLIAWLSLMLSLVPLAFGIHSLRTRGKPSGQRAGDPSLLEFEKTTALVTSGIYKYIRHPLYSSLFWLTWGIYFKLPSVPGLVISITAVFFLIMTARADEAECVQFFGGKYREYMQRTKMFIPYVF